MNHFPSALSARGVGLRWLSCPKRRIDRHPTTPLAEYPAAASACAAAICLPKGLPEEPLTEISLSRRASAFAFAAVNEKPGGTADLGDSAAKRAVAAVRR